MRKKNAILEMYPLIRYLKELEKSPSLNKFNNSKGFSIEQLNLLSFLKSPISSNSFNDNFIY